MYSDSVCLETCDQETFDGPYIFTIFDTFGDGLGGGFGDTIDSGTYVVTLDGVVKASGGGDFGYQESADFSDCDYSYSPSLSPSMLPSIMPSVSLSPSTSPTECQGVTLEVGLETDGYGFETSWEVTKNGILIMSGGGYESYTEYTETGCLPVEDCDQGDFDGPYMFTIYDSYGDGFLSGGYTVTLGGVVKAIGGGNFGLQESVLFSDCDFTLEPSFSPSFSPTESPTTSPTAFPTSFCPGVYITVTIRTDRYGDETYWKLAKNGNTILSGDGYEDRKEYTSSICVDGCDEGIFDELYTFSVFDRVGDGMSNGGGYVVSVGGVVKAEGNGDFGYAESKSFSTCYFDLLRFMSNNVRSGADSESMCLSAKETKEARVLESKSAETKTKSKSSVKISKIKERPKSPGKLKAKKTKAAPDSADSGKKAKKGKKVSKQSLLSSAIILEECDVSNDFQVWRIDQRGYLRNKGMPFKCLEGNDKGDLMMSSCLGEFNPNQSFGVLQLHGTIVAINSGRAITSQGEDGYVRLQDYRTEGRTDLLNQWTAEIIAE